MNFIILNSSGMDDYHSVRYFCFDAIQYAIRKIELLKFPRCPAITHIEKRVIDKLREESDDPTFWF